MSEKLNNPEIFINRKAEKQYFLDYFNNVPRNILFVYWPKSTWKTTLIRKVIWEELSDKNFDINYINMRDILIQEFLDFKKLFFPENLKDNVKGFFKSSNIKWWIKAGIFWDFWFSWEAKDIEVIKTNFFVTVKKKILEQANKWIKTVIVLDEFQYLKDIFVDDKKEIRLINELFKFFISITKQYNLAHVVCLTSDSYYMEELYNDTKLANTSKFYLIEHLNKKDIYYWLDEKENCPRKMLKDIWENLWWSVWEIWQVLVSYKNTGDYHDELNDLLQVKYSLVAEYYREKLEEKNKKDFLEILESIVKKWEYIIPLNKNHIELIKILVDKDIWFYDTKKAKITANSKSLEIAFKRLLKELKYKK